MSDRPLEQTPEGWSPGGERYAQVFAPFTGQFATDAAAHLGIGPSDRVLDVAAGSGAFTLAAAARGAEVLATDFAPGMLDALHRRSEGLPIRTAVMDGQALELATDAFSVAASMFGVIFFPDASAGLRELARVTRPGGRLAVGSWSDAGPRLSRLVGEAVLLAAPGLELPAPSRPVPLGTPAECEATLAAAGWRDVTVHEITHDLVVPEPADFFRSLAGWSAPAIRLVEALGPRRVDAAADAFAEVVARSSPSGDRVPFSALISIGGPA